MGTIFWPKLQTAMWKTSGGGEKPHVIVGCGQSPSTLDKRLIGGQMALTVLGGAHTTPLCWLRRHGGSHGSAVTGPASLRLLLPQHSSLQEILPSCAQEGPCRHFGNSSSEPWVGEAGSTQGQWQLSQPTMRKKTLMQCCWANIGDGVGKVTNGFKGAKHFFGICL